TLAAPSVTSVDEYRSPARGLKLALAERSPRARDVTFLIDSPIELPAKLELFDVQGRHTATAFEGRLAKGSTTVTWALSARDGAQVATGVYFARLSFPGGSRTVQVPVAR